MAIASGAEGWVTSQQTRECGPKARVCKANIDLLIKHGHLRVQGLGEGAVDRCGFVTGFESQYIEATLAARHLGITKWTLLYRYRRAGVRLLTFPCATRRANLIFVSKDAAIVREGTGFAACQTRYPNSGAACADRVRHEGQKVSCPTPK